MSYTAIIKDGGLFIPNVFTELDDGSARIVQVDIDIEAIREQLSTTKAQLQKTPKKQAPKAAKTSIKRMPKPSATQPLLDKSLSTEHQSAIDELDGLDDSELSEMLKAYVNEGQISLENL